MLRSLILKKAIRRLYSSGTKSSRKAINPGVQNRLKIFKDNNPDIDKVNIEEAMFDVHENDFMKADQFYDQYERESSKLKRMIKYKRIEREYFGSNKSPNLLTWSEKEHIRYLSYSDPAKWTPEKLADSFPANVEIIKKLIKSQWKPMNVERIKKHDQRVSDNWKALKRGEIDLPPSFKEHVQKFVTRSGSYNFTNATVKESSLMPSCSDAPPSSSEFVDIIKSWKKKQEPEKSSLSTHEKITGTKPDRPQETFVLDEENPVRLKQKYYTLDALRKEVGSQHDTQKELSLVDQHFIKENAQTSNLAEPCSSNHFPADLISTSDEFGKYKKTVLNKSSQIDDDIVQRIIIPEEKKKDDCVYKVGDCYYSNQGEFLYKVPGMT